jgi:hypothetical protein
MSRVLCTADQELSNVGNAAVAGAINACLGAEEWVIYESELNRFVPRFPQVLLCSYDLNEFSGESIRG